MANRKSAPHLVSQKSPTPSTRSIIGLDWTNFFLSDVRTGVGPFVAIYLAGQHWSVAGVGFALTVAEVAGVLTQAPGGALMDRVRSKRLTLVIALAGLALCSIMLAERPSRVVVTLAQAILGVTGSIFVPAVGAITLGLVGYSCLGARTGRNNGFASAGNVFAAITMAVIGYRYSTRAIFFFVALLAVPTTLAILLIRGDEIDYDLARGALSETKDSKGGLRAIFCDRRLIVFASVVILLHLGNGAMLPLAGQMLAKARPERADLWMGALLTVPQAIMALASPWIGRFADLHGRKPIFLFGLAFLPIRALLFSFLRTPAFLITAQVLDGITAGIFMVVAVLIVADCTEGTGHYNLALGAIWAAVGVGASVSTTMAGLVTQKWGYGPGFISLAVAGFAAFVVFWLLMPETRNWPAARAKDALPEAA
jgi:MFS family permease